MPSDMPSTTDGVVLISPPPITLNAPSSEAELTLTQQVWSIVSNDFVDVQYFSMDMFLGPYTCSQMMGAKTRRVILEGGGDCDVNQLNNRLSFMDSYQQHLFQKTAVKVFGTANMDTFYEQT